MDATKGRHHNITSITLMARKRIGLIIREVPKPPIMLAYESRIKFEFSAKSEDQYHFLSFFP